MDFNALLDHEMLTFLFYLLGPKNANQMTGHICQCYTLGVDGLDIGILLSNI